MECLIVFVKARAHCQCDILCGLLVTPGHGIRRALQAPLAQAFQGKHLTSLFLGSPAKAPANPDDE